MEEKRWESCNAEALLDEFFSQNNLRQLALSTGELLDCPLMVLDDTFRIAAYRLPLGFSDALFETAVRCGEITYEAGAIISKNAMLTAGWADYVQLADSPYRRRFAPLISAGVRLGYLICVDTDGHLEKIPPQTWELVEHILSKQLFMEVSRQDKPSETAEDILMHLLDGGFSSAAHFQLQASGTYLADFHPRAFALIDLEAYRSAYMGKRHLKEELEAEDGNFYPMTGFLEGRGYRTESLGRFGYVTLEAKSDLVYLRQGETIRGHEFHYWDSTCNGQSFKAQKPMRKKNWLCINSINNLFAGYPHLHYYSNIDFASNFIHKCNDYKKGR